MAETSARAGLTPVIGGPSIEVQDRERAKAYPVTPASGQTWDAGVTWDDTTYWS